MTACYHSNEGVKMAETRISIDAEIVELSLPEERRIQVRAPADLQAIAWKVGKPILRELVNALSFRAGPEPTKKHSHILAVYDGPWVYYCEIEAEEPAREEAAQ